MTNTMIKALTGLALGTALFVAGCSSTMDLSTTRTYDQTFLSNYKVLQPRGNDFVYASPDAQRLLAAAKGVLIDQPEIHIAPDSPYSGAKPADLTAIAESMRSDLSGALTKAGYNVVTSPGPNILVLRLALTNVYLETKERGVLEYTPIGFVVGTAVTAMQSVMSKVDILGMTLQAQVNDSTSQTLIFELVAPRGGNKERITFEQFQAQMQTWGQRLGCQISNAKVPSAQQVDCSKLGNTGVTPPPK